MVAWLAVSLSGCGGSSKPDGAAGGANGAGAAEAGVGATGGMNSKSHGEQGGSSGVTGARGGSAGTAGTSGVSSPESGAPGGMSMGDGGTPPTEGGASQGVGGAAGDTTSGTSGDTSTSGGNGGEAGSDPEPEWSDVVPVRTRVGPRTTPRELFISQVQHGAYWETPSGDVLTTFRTSITHPQPGIAIDDYNYTLQTIVGNAIQPVPDLAVGTCRYQDWPYGSCSVGPDAGGPTPRSLVAEDGTILVVREQRLPDEMMYPVVDRLDPATGTFSPVIELRSIEMQASNIAYTATLALRQLADGTIALSMAMVDEPARIVVFDMAGERLAQREGFVFGERWQRFALFVGETSRLDNQRFDWWDPRTNASAPSAFSFPSASPMPAFRTFVTPIGNVIFSGYPHTTRLVHIDEQGVVVEDRPQQVWHFLAALPDGRYLATEKDPSLGYVLRIYDRRGESTLLYDQATLLRDAGWPQPTTSLAGYPHIAPLEFGAIVDDAGNAYVGLVMETGGDTTTKTYLVAFAPDGQKLWGYNLDTTRLGACLAHSVLSGHRLVVRCDGRYVRRFIILGE